MATASTKPKPSGCKSSRDRCQKFCSHGLCKNRGKSHSTDADLKFIPFPKACLAYRNEQIEKILGTKTDNSRKHNTADCSQCSKALKWLNLCKRHDFKHLLDIRNGRHICSKHFIDPSGPTPEHPDPLPANLSPDAISLIRKRARKPPTCRTTLVSPPKRKRTMPHVAEHENNDEQCDSSMTNSSQSTIDTEEVVKDHGSNSTGDVVVTVLVMDEEGVDANGHSSTVEDTSGVGNTSNATVIKEVVPVKRHVDMVSEVPDVPHVPECVGNLRDDTAVDEQVVVTQDSNKDNETSDVTEVTECVGNLPLDSAVDEAMRVTEQVNVVNEVSNVPEVTADGSSVTPAMTVNAGFPVNQQLVVSSTYSLNPEFLNTVVVNKYNNFKTYACSFFDTPWSVATNPNGMTLSKPGKNIGTNVTEVRVYCMNDIWICNVYVYGKPIPLDSPLHEKSKRVCSLQSLDKLITELNHWNPCLGIVNDDKFSSIQHSQGYVCHFTDSIRSSKCKMLTKITTCSPCSNYNYRLNARLATQKKQPVGGSRECNNRFLSREQLQSKLNICKKEQKSMQRSLRVMKERCEKLISDSDSCFCKDLDKCYEEDDFGRIFIEDQMKASARKATNGFRWHPTMVKFALYFHRKYPAAYRSLRFMLCLPSPRTLHDYRKGTNNKGALEQRIPREVIQRVTTDEENEASGNNHYFSLVIDEIKISEGLVYKKQTDQLLGFVDLDDSEDELAKIYNKHTKEVGQKSDAIGMIQCTVKGITNNESFLYSYFPNDGLTVEKLYGIIREAIEKLELKGVKILTIVCDGHRVNREFMKLTSPDKENPYFMDNPYSLDEVRWIHFIPDAVHLIKAVRDSFSSSICPTSTRSGRRLLTKNGNHILWKYVEDVFSWDKTNYPRVLPLLTEAHVNLNDQSRTELKYAAQVLSNSVATAIENQCGTPAMETVKFIRMFNKFFEIVNGRHSRQGERDQDSEPYTSAEDERLLWLENDFTNYLNEWETQVDNMKGNLSVAERGNMKLASPTIESLHVMVKSVPSVIRYVLEKGVSSIPAGKLIQDPLDNFSTLLLEDA